MSTPNSSELIEGIRSGVYPGVQSAPMMGTILSENKPEPDGLVGSPKTRLVRHCGQELQQLIVQVTCSPLNIIIPDRPHPP